MAEMMGSVYILGNKSMPGWVKVGRTQGLASQHARRMTRKTGVSEPFEVAYKVPMSVCAYERTYSRACWMFGCKYPGILQEKRSPPDFDSINNGFATASTSA